MIFRHGVRGASGIGGQRLKRWIIPNYFELSGMRMRLLGEVLHERQFLIEFRIREIVR